MVKSLKRKPNGFLPQSEQNGRKQRRLTSGESVGFKAKNTDKAMVLKNTDHVIVLRPL
ncbi:hypothetical protein JGUZn3_24130 [Entomobacter blattae]|uniref:Uncharacterized protein n=1 Tax=Entomobacter blattae TaxID=2762277 RepID=A0A7H1NV03_9PROT|nr:hypothetical protein JGUZn3_24130 [Entomobacter blattae]